MKHNFPILPPVIALVGPTAIGKTDVSLSLAVHFECEVVNVDSMQVYRYMDIGTAKASIRERQIIPHHLIDIVNPDDSYDAGRFCDDALKSIADIHSRNKIPLLTGGTGLYLRSLLEGLVDDIGQFPQIRESLQQRMEKVGCSKLHEELISIDRDSGKRIHQNDTHRLLRALEIYYGTSITWSEHLHRRSGQSVQKRFANFLLFGLTCDRQTLYKRINQRTATMLSSGLKGEVQWLLDKGYGRDLKSMQAIGYRHMTAHLLDGRGLDEVQEALATDTRRYAKRQYTWFRKMDVEWYDAEEKITIFKRIKDFLNALH